MIYFAQHAQSWPVKIGCTKDVPSRIRQLEFVYGLTLNVLKTIPGERAEEQEIHARFQDSRFGNTEQFRPTDELSAFVGCDLGDCSFADAPMPYASFSEGNTVLAARLRLGLTQEEVARRRGITKGSYMQYELGIRPLKLAWLWDHAIALGIDPHELDPRLQSNRGA